MSDVSEAKVIQECGDDIRDILTNLSLSMNKFGLLLEVAYLSVQDHPDLAAEFRMIANETRAYHMMTLGYIKLNMVTLSTILQTLLPLILSGVKLKKSALMKPLYLKIQQLLIKMRDGVTKQRTRVWNLQLKIQETSFDVNTLIIGKQKGETNSNASFILSGFDVSECLVTIGNMLINIIEIWDRMESFLTNTIQRDLGKCFIDAFGDDECSELFNEELVKMENRVKHYEELCSKYVEQAEKSIPQIYRFLSEPIHWLSKEWRQERTKKMIAHM